MSTEQKTSMPETLRTMVYGQTRTFIDLLKVMNEEVPIKDFMEARDRLQTYLNMRHGRFGGGIAHLACRILENWEDTKKNAGGIDLDELEAALMERRGAPYFALTHADEVYYHYCVAKLLHYIQFLNEFRNYISWGDIRSDLETTLFQNPCGGDIAHGGFFYISNRMLWETVQMIDEHWEEVTDNGHLSNEKLEKVFFKDFQEMVESIGLEKTIEQAYTYQGCHPDWLVPWKVVGPFFLRKANGTYDVRCGSSPRPDSIFEMRAAEPLLFQNDDFIHVREYIVPIRDYSLPVYHSFWGKLHFTNQEEKNEFINRIQMDYINNGH